MDNDPPHPTLRFEDVFWGTGGDPTEGVRVLHEVFVRHLREMEDLIALVRVRVALEETATSKFADMARLSASPSAPPSSVLSPTSTRALGIGAGKKSGFLPTGNGVTSVGSTPVSGGILGGIKGFANVFSSATAELASSTFDNVKEASANIIASGVSAARNVLSDPASLPLPPPPQSSSANSLTSLLKSSGSGAGLEALTSDAANLSIAGASGKTDDASSLFPVSRALREQMMAMAAVHRRHADDLTLNVLSPLTGFVDESYRKLSKKRAEMDAAVRQLAKVSAEIDSLRHQYTTLVQIAVDEDDKNKMDAESRKKPPVFGPVIFGSRSISAQELHDMVNIVKREVKLNGILTPVGMYENCFMGDDAVSQIQVHHPNVSRPDIRQLCQELVNRRLITPVVGGADGKFSGALPYAFGGRPLLKSGEPPSMKARKDAEVAKLGYKDAISNSEHARAALDFHIMSYLNAVQEAETNRLIIAEKALTAFEDAQAAVASEIAAMWTRPTDEDGSEEGSKMLSVVKPMVGLQHIAERYRTGHKRTPPFVFESFEGERSPHQLFGIGIDELAKATGENVPSCVRHCVGLLATPLLGYVDPSEGAAVQETFEVLQNVASAACDAWIMPVSDQSAVQVLRGELNKLDSKDVDLTKLRKYSTSVVASVLRSFFLEAPEGIVPPEFYDKIATIYEASESFEARSSELKAILGSLTAPCLQTLKVVASYCQALVKALDREDKRLNNLFWSLSSMILRPRQESRETLAHNHPCLFTKDLLNNYIDLLEEPLPLLQFIK